MGFVALAQVPVWRLELLTPEQRRDRLFAIAWELHGRFWETLLTMDMRVTRRTLRRWMDLSGPIPNVVMVAAGAMVAAKRAGV